MARNGSAEEPDSKMELKNGQRGFVCLFFNQWIFFKYKDKPNKLQHIQKCKPSPIEKSEGDKKEQKEKEKTYNLTNQTVMEQS